MFDSVFTYTDADLSVSEPEEAALIERAQAGDEEASLTLLHAYGPVLRRSVGAVSRSLVDNGTLDVSVEDLQGAALVAFFEVLADHDPEQNPRLAGRVFSAVRRHLVDEVTAKSAFAVPERTLSRFHGILKTYGGDPALAEEHASEHGMSREVFREIYAAAHGTTSLDGLADADGESTSRELLAAPVFTPSPVVDVEDRILVDVALRAVDDEEERICRLSYGFTEYDPQPDAEIAHRMGLTRPTVQRKRGKALGKMRKALGVTHV